MSDLQTLWSHLTWADKAVIAANLVLGAVFFVSWRRKRRRLAAAQEKTAGE